MEEEKISERVLIDHPVAEAHALLPSMVGRVAVVTGASSGLGVETTKWLALRGCDEVILAVRNTAKAEGVVNSILSEWGDKVPDLRPRLVVMELDLADLASVRAFAAAVAARHGHLDILVNNAGINAPLGSTTADGFELMWGTNHLGPALLTHELMPLLLAAPNRAVVSTCTSGAVDNLAPKDNLVADTDDGLTQWPAYGRAKAANLVFAVELQRRLSAAGVAHVRSTSSHPGWTYTGLVTDMNVAIRALNRVFSQNVQMGTTPQLVSVGAGLLPADDPKSGSQHNFFSPSGCHKLRGPPVEMPPFREAEVTDLELGERVWQLTNRSVGIDSWAFE